MTVEELLQPRYKVIADYPLNRHFPLNQIFILDWKEGRNHVANFAEPYSIVEPKEGLPLGEVLPATEEEYKSSKV